MFSLGLRSHRLVREGVKSTVQRQEDVKFQRFFSGANVATVTQPIAPGCPGRVRYQASWWPAQCNEGTTLNVGDEVRVIGVQNITLLVEPVRVEPLNPSPTEMAIAGDPSRR
jgi:membrane protein implicated in regulation of membrane protease activity